MLPSQPIGHGPERSSTAAVWGGVAACALRVGHNASARRLLPTPCFCPQLPRLVPKRLADRSEGDYDAPEEAAEDDRCVLAARAAAGRRGPGGVSGTESSSTPGLTHTPSLLPDGARTGRVGRVVSDCISLFILFTLQRTFRSTPKVIKICTIRRQKEIQPVLGIGQTCTGKGITPAQCATDFTSVDILSRQTVSHVCRAHVSVRVFARSEIPFFGLFVFLGVF